MAGLNPLKEIQYRGGLVRFVIPVGWVEEYDPEGSGTFYDPAPDRGTLRLSVLTIRHDRLAGTTAGVDALRAIRESGWTKIEELPNGNALAKSRTEVEEGGERGALLTWHLAQVVPTRHARVANFTYAVLSRIEKTPMVQADLARIDASVRAARFHPSLGE